MLSKNCRCISLFVLITFGYLFSIWFLIIILTNQIISKKYDYIRLISITIVPMLLCGFSVICLGFTGESSSVEMQTQQDETNIEVNKEENIIQSKNFIVVSNVDNDIVLGTQIC